MYIEKLIFKDLCKTDYHAFVVYCGYMYFYTTGFDYDNDGYMKITNDQIYEKTKVTRNIITRSTKLLVEKGYLKIKNVGNLNNQRIGRVIKVMGGGNV